MANDPDNYNPTNNTFIATQGQSELLYCWACHTSNTGNLRDPGKFVIPSTTAYLIPQGHSFPDTKGSNICMNCHSGRQTGEYIKNYSGSLSVNFGGFNSHYLTAGGTLYRTTGYEYNGKDYTNVSFFKHDQIGSNSNGPCVTCHMRGNANHLFTPVEKDKNTGLITSIPANDRVCSQCHTGQYALTPEKLNSEVEEYESALDALRAGLEAKNIYYCSNYPYFFTDNTCSTPYTSWVNKDTLGAAYNLNLLKHEPGAYAHNRFYTKRLIYDSLDFIYDGNLDGDVAEAIAYLATLGYPYFDSSKASYALNYLNNGSRP